MNARRTWRMACAGAPWASAAPLAAAALALSGCSDDGSNEGPGLGGSGGTGAGTTGEAGSPPAPPMGMGGSNLPTAGSGGTSSGGAGGGSGFAESGVCGARGQSPVSADSFAGYEEFYLIGDRGFGTDICVVRFDVSRVGEAPAGCEDCVWTHLVEYSNPQILTDVDGVCASSALGMDSARIGEIDGSQAAYGFVYEYSGHVSVLMKYDEATSTWGPNGNATWSEEAGELRFDRRDGICGY
jgi:hypothetical protein